MRRLTICVAAAVLAAWPAAAERPASAPASRPDAQWLRPIHPVGFRVFKWSYRAGDGSTKPLATVVWYPAASGVSARRHAYCPGIVGRAAQDAPANTAAGPFPLIVYSHGYGGSAIGSVFLAEYLAARGYVVAAPDHSDPISMMRNTGPTGAKNT